MQEEHTRTRRVDPSMTARTLWRLGRKRRRDLLLAWLRVFPDWGVLPQIAQILAIEGNPSVEWKRTDSRSK
jgi:hypothetical protein